jgi:hypothetical protein
MPREARLEVRFRQADASSFPYFKAIVFPLFPVPVSVTTVYFVKMQEAATANLGGF